MYSHFFSGIWQIQNIWSVVDLLRRNPRWWSLIISSAYWVNLDSRKMEKNLVCSWQLWYASIITTICSIVLLINRYNDRFLPLLRQLLLIQNRNNKCIDLTAKYSTSCLYQFSWNLINTCWFVTFGFSTAITNSKTFGSVSSGSTVCISLCLTSLTPCTLNSWEKCFLHLAKILWESATKSLFSSFTVLVLGW